MSPAALRLALLALLLPALAAAEPAPRATPTRPGGSGGPPALTAAPRIAALSVTRVNGVDHVSLREAAALLGLQFSWREGERRLALSDATGKVEFEIDSREVSVRGLRLFLGRPVIARNGAALVSRIDFERLLLARLRPAQLGPPPPRPQRTPRPPPSSGRSSKFKVQGSRFKVPEP